MQAEATARAAAAVSGGAAGVGAGEGVAAGEAGDAALLAEVQKHLAAERACSVTRCAHSSTADGGG